MDNDSTNIRRSVFLSGKSNSIQEAYIDKVKENIRLKHQLKQLLIKGSPGSLSPLLRMSSEISVANLLSEINDLEI